VVEETPNGLRISTAGMFGVAELHGMFGSLR
jgi:hypothetical protein